jgi:glutamine phosphoribosylpyrophosphate amidotransferase
MHKAKGMVRDVFLHPQCAHCQAQWGLVMRYPTAGNAFSEDARFLCQCAIWPALSVAQRQSDQRC